MASISSFSEHSKFISIYTGPGADPSCIKSTEELLQKHLPVDRICYLKADLGTIFQNRVESSTILVIPGGNGFDQISSILPYTESMSDKMRYKSLLVTFLMSGGGIHATCAGAITLSKSLFFKEFPSSQAFPSTPLSLFSSSALVPIDYKSKQREFKDMVYADVLLADNDFFPESLKGKTVRCLDATSPGWPSKFISPDDIVLGKYLDCTDENTAAILTRNFGKGKIWAQGPHLEFSLDDLTPEELSLTSRAEPKLTPVEQTLRRELFYHSFRALGLPI